MFSSGTISGNFPSGINVEVVSGKQRESATVNVTIQASSLTKIELQPSFAVVERTTSQRFEAAGFDKYGNEINGIAFLWQATGGVVSQEGLFTAGTEPGSNELSVGATFGGNSRSASATIPIPPYWVSVADLLQGRC